MVKMNEGGVVAAPSLVGVDWLRRHLDDDAVKIVDARSSYDYGKGHVRNAINIELTDIIRSRGGLPAMCPPEKHMSDLLGSKGIENDSCIVVYDNFGGLFSGRLFWTLEHFGHGDVRIFDGSIKHWLDAGEGFTKEVPALTETKYQTLHREGNLATKEWIIDHLQDPNVAFLDVRKPGEYAGRIAFGKRGGHIPGAVHVHWVEVIDPSTGRFKPPNVLRAMYEGKGLVSDKEVVTYCWMGMRASHGYMMLRLLGYPRVRMYDSSWSEWGDIDECTVEASP